MPWTQIPLCPSVPTPFLSATEHTYVLISCTYTATTFRKKIKTVKTKQHQRLSLINCGSFVSFIT